MTGAASVKKRIDTSYPRGWFVAVDGEQILGDAADFRELEGKLRTLSVDPRSVLVVEAGVDYPEQVTIFV